MAEIKEIKSEIRHRKWMEQIQECQSSGKKVAEWCKENGLSSNTYYRRLRVIREEALKRQPELHSIVPVSMSDELSDISSDKPTAESPEKIMIRKNGMEIELPSEISEKTLMLLLRGLSQC